MMRHLFLAVAALALATLAVEARAADDENPIVTTVKSKVKDKDKPFGMAVVFKVKAGSEKEFETAFAPCAKATKKEPGCLTYHFNRDLDEAGQYVVYEQFKSIAAFEEHAKSKHVEELRKQLPALLDGEPKVKVFAILSGE